MQKTNKMNFMKRFYEATRKPLVEPAELSDPKNFEGGESLHQVGDVEQCARKFLSYDTA